MPDPALPVALVLLWLVATAAAALVVYRVLHRHDTERIAELERAKCRLESEALDLAEQTTRELRTNELRHRLIMEGAGVGFWEWDTQRDEVRTEGGLPDQSGFVLDSLTLPSNVWFGNVHGDDQAQMWQRLDAHMRGETTAFEAEYRIQTNDRQWRWVMARAQVVERDEAGKARRVSGTQIDIDTRKRAELALEEERRLFNAGPVIVTHVLLGEQPRYTYFSSNVCELWGYPTEFAQRGILRADLVHPEDLERKRRQYEQHISTGVTRFETELRYRMADGSYRWHALYGHLVRLGEVPEMVGYLIDIETRKQAETRSHLQQARLEELVNELRDSEHERTLLHQTGDMLNSSTHMDEACAVVQRTAQRLFPGWSGGIATVGLGGELDLRTHWGTAQLCPQFSGIDCWALRRGRSYAFLDAQRSIACAHHAAAPTLPTLCVPMVANGELIGSLHLQADSAVDEATVERTLQGAERLAETLNLSLSNLRLRASLQEQAVRDGLTGLHNRRYLNERLPAELQRCKRGRQPLALAMIDIDHFKRFNDSHGHEAGDLVLAAISRCLIENLRAYDLACRYGGEEFCLVLSGCDLVSASERLETIRSAAHRLRIRHGDATLPAVTLSAGLAAAHPGETPVQLISRADAALYAAKAAGRDRIHHAAEPALERRVG